MDKINNLFTFLFKIDGSKINRKQMWFFFVPYLILQSILVPHRHNIEVFVIIMILLFSFIVVSIKRWRDRNKSPLWVILNFIPIINLWAAIELLFLKSVESTTD